LSVLSVFFRKYVEKKWVEAGDLTVANKGLTESNEKLKSEGAEMKAEIKKLLEEKAANE